MNRVFEGMKIFAKYDKSFTTSAEHDKIFVMCEDSELMSLWDKKTLDSLGWKIDDGGDENCWRIFT